MKIAAAVVAALVVAGCSSGVTVPKPSSRSMSPLDDAYLSVMRHHFPTAHLSTGLLLGARRQMCEQFREGTPWIEMVAVLTKQAGYSGHDAGFVIAASVRTGCPQFLSRLP